MRHQRAGKKLGRDSAHRKALYANLAGALIEHGRIKTTVAKAKAVKPIAEQMITLGRRGDLARAAAGDRVPPLAGRRAQALRRGRARASRTGRAATRGSSSSARARATRPRWSTSSSSTTSPRGRRSRPSGTAWHRLGIVLLVGAILLAVFVLPQPWNYVAVIAGAVCRVLRGGALHLVVTRRRRPTVGAEAFVGRVAESWSRCGRAGRVRIDGELWNARCEDGEAARGRLGSRQARSTA